MKLDADELIELRTTKYRATKLWVEAFDFYNEQNTYKLHIGCKSCYGKVYSFIYRQVLKKKMS